MAERPIKRRKLVLGFEAMKKQNLLRRPMLFKSRDVDGSVLPPHFNPKMFEIGGEDGSFLSPLEPPEKWLESLQFSWWDDPLIGEVRNQGSTNTCYAFAVSDSIYANQLLNHCTPSYKVSEKDFMDHLHLRYPPPDLKYDFHGHPIVKKEGIGNYLYNAFSYAIKDGVLTASDYPFEGYLVKRRWEDRPQGSKVFISDAKLLQSNDEFQIKTELFKQPVVGGLICAPSFEKWRPQDGVYMGLTQKEVDTGANKKYGCHTLLIVGFGCENGTYYYLAKNSWGRKWGYYGFVKLAVNTVHGYEGFYYPVGQPYVSVERFPSVNSWESSVPMDWEISSQQETREEPQVDEIYVRSFMKDPKFPLKNPRMLLKGLLVRCHESIGATKYSAVLVSLLREYPFLTEDVVEMALSVMSGKELRQQCSGFLLHVLHEIAGSASCAEAMVATNLVIPLIRKAISWQGETILALQTLKRVLFASNRARDVLIAQSLRDGLGECLVFLLGQAEERSGFISQNHECKESVIRALAIEILHVLATGGPNRTRTKIHK